MANKGKYGTMNKESKIIEKKKFEKIGIWNKNKQKL